MLPSTYVRPLSLLSGVQQGEVNVEQAVEKLRLLPYENLKATRFFSKNAKSFDIVQFALLYSTIRLYQISCFLKIPPECDPEGCVVPFI